MIVIFRHHVSQNLQKKGVIWSGTSRRGGATRAVSVCSSCRSSSDGLVRADRDVERATLVDLEAHVDALLVDGDDARLDLAVGASDARL